MDLEMDVAAAQSTKLAAPVRYNAESWLHTLHNRRISGAIAVAAESTGARHRSKRRHESKHTGQAKKIRAALEAEAMKCGAAGG